MKCDLSKTELSGKKNVLTFVGNLDPVRLPTEI